MGLNIQKGNMYAFVTHTWNPIKGRCEHDCTYCYMERFWSMMKNDELRLDEKEFREFDRDIKKFGDGQFIFVGSSTDMWACNVEGDWIERILEFTKGYPDNTYLFQTKNPGNFESWIFESNTVLGITLETNRPIDTISKATFPTLRAAEFVVINHPRKMITIEPIIDFDLQNFVNLIKMIAPEWVNIGADSGGNKLPEPSKEKVLELINELKTFTQVRNKTNLKRIMTK